MNDANEPGTLLRTFADGGAEPTLLDDMQISHTHSIQVWTFSDPSAPVSVGMIHADKTVLLNMQNMPRRIRINSLRSRSSP
ncbi:hypothetical protein AA309_06895 [Microvirga vignae]|uniref:Uncharacterized protein n=1 Tax=Microvirga vignae TaxID=1225564 RepID=A0A0H1REX6_9HYPH|nr:hypothetical protein [Microvirga vignae]KLK93750.1 hypothetical protein AA309_06895 [Microvirga vignae]